MMLSGFMIHCLCFLEFSLGVTKDIASKAHLMPLFVFMWILFLHNHLVFNEKINFKS